MKFKNAPLVELVAELRWGPGTVVMPSMANIAAFMQGTSMSSNANEEFFMRFGAKIAAYGYTRVERRIPEGMPIMPFQAVYAYRLETPEQGSSLYLLGPGVFSANITPPYDNWEVFRPLVERGVESLIASRAPADREIPFGRATLRYIDLFKNDLTEGKATMDFLRETLGIDISVPRGVDALAPVDVKPVVQFQIELPDNLLLLVKAQDGQAKNEKGVILDMSIAATSEIPATGESVLNAFDTAHLKIRKVFSEMTGPISHLMKPILDA